jgi:hypothetical protein
LASLLSFAPSLFAGLFGDPNKKLRKQVNKLTGAGNVGKVTDQFYQQAVGSPAFSQAQGSIAAGANAAGGQLASSLGQRGIGTSGTGAILSSLMPSVVGQQQAGLRTAAHSTAQNQAQQAIQAQLAALMGTQGPSPQQQLFSGGLEAFGPFLQQLLSQMGQGGATGGPRMGQPGFTYPVGR